MRNVSKHELERLRPLAEEILDRRVTDEDLSDFGLEKLLHELKVTKIELEMQNEELKTSQRRLEASQQKYFKLYESAPVAYLNLDPNGVVFEVNSRACRLLKQTRDRISGRHISKFLDKSCARSFVEHFQRVMTTGSHETMEVLFRREDGRGVTVRVDSIVSTEVETGRCFCLCALTDVSETRRAHEELEKAHKVLESHVENTPLVVVEWDRDFRVTRWSSNAGRLFGWSEQEVKGMLPEEWTFVHEEDAASVVRVMKELLDGEKPNNVSFNRNYTKDGGVVFCEWHNSAVFNERGELVSILSLVQDMSERVRDREKLVRSRNMLSGAFEALKDLILVVDRDFRVVMSNDSCQACGDGGTTCHKILMGGDGPCPDCPVNVLFQDGKARSFQQRTPDGRLFEVSVAPIFDEHGRVVLAVEHLRDVTARFRQEKALQESETKFRAVFENAAVGVFITDTNGNYLDVNYEFARMHGLEREMIAGMNFRDLVHEEDAARNLAYFDSVAGGTAGAYTLEKRHLTAHGGLIDVRLAVSAVRDLNRSVQYIIGIVEDVSDRKTAEQELEAYRESLEQMVLERTREFEEALKYAEEARDRTDVILKSVGDGLVVTDMHNRIVLMNRAAEDILGVSFSEAIGRPVEYAIEESTFKELTHFIGKSRKNTDYQFDFQHQDRKGKTRHLRARTSVVVDRQGRQRGVVSIMHDVTREREVDRMKSEFISTAAHELRTPMTSIQGFSELLLTRDDFKDDEKRRFMKHINSSAVALSGIISDLLDISRIESGKGLSINPRGLNLKELIEHKIEALTVQFPDYSFVLDMPEKVLPALADPNKIDQVLDNLLSNAVKYSPEKGEIRVALECSGLEQSVSVADSGQGMTPEQVDRVFEKFYRGGAANSGVPGTGLGMSIVRHIVEAHGGKVRVKSDHGRGTTVSFSLPACGGAALPPGVAEYVPG